MHDPYKRRVRIEYKPPEQSEQSKKPIGYMVSVHDAETGEAITNISEVIVYLRVNSINEAAITYYEQNDHGALIAGPDSDAIRKRGMSANPELDVLAMERRNWLETVVFQALGEASLCWSERPRGVFQDKEVKRIGDELIDIIVEHFNTQSLTT